MTKPILIRLRWLLDLSKLSKPKESTSQQTARQNNQFSLFCSPILQWILQSNPAHYSAAKKRNHGHNKRRPRILRRIPLPPLARQPLQKLSFLRNGKGKDYEFSQPEFLPLSLFRAWMSGFCRFSTNFSSLFSFFCGFRA